MKRNMDTLKKIEQWFQEQCNGSWEHEYGISIDTLDNPGWIVKIDLIKTKYCDLRLDQCQVNRTQSDWISYQVKNSTFVACGGITNLYEIFDTFFSVISSEAKQH